MLWYWMTVILNAILNISKQLNDDKVASLRYFKALQLNTSSRSSNISP